MKLRTRGLAATNEAGYQLKQRRPSFEIIQQNNLINNGYLMLCSSCSLLYCVCCFFSITSAVPIRLMLCQPPGCCPSYLPLHQYPSFNPGPDGPPARNRGNEAAPRVCHLPVQTSASALPSVKWPWKGNNWVIFYLQ